MRPWALSRAEVTTDDGTFHGPVSLLIQHDVLTLRPRGTRDVIAEKPGATAVTPLPGERNRWSVTFEDGTEWTVAKAKGCGCGGKS